MQEVDSGSVDEPSRTLAAAVVDASLACWELDDARRWLPDALGAPMPPLGVEVWVYDRSFTQVLLVRHRWRGWVPAGGKVERGETPREAASRELAEETGVRAALLPIPAVVAVRAYHRDWPATLGLSYVSIVDSSTPLRGEPGQPVRWQDLGNEWPSYFAEDPDRIRRYVGRLRAIPELGASTASRLGKTGPASDPDPPKAVSPMRL